MTAIESEQADPSVYPVVCQQDHTSGIWKMIGLENPCADKTLNPGLAPLEHVPLPPSLMGELSSS